MQAYTTDRIRNVVLLGHKVSQCGLQFFQQ